MTPTLAPSTESGVHPATDTERSSRDPWMIASVAVAILLVMLTVWPIIDAGRAALDLVWRPSGDWAVLTLRVEDVGRSTPLIGPYSRFGWNHPGPLLLWLLAIPYHLFGDRPESLLAAAAALNTVSVGALGALAWRRGRLPLVAATMGVIALIMHAMGPSMIRDPWNPFITLFPLALIVFLTWSVIEGDHWMWPPLVFCLSFQLQSHIGYLPIVIVLVVVGGVIAWRWSGLASLLPQSSTRRWWVVGISFAVLVGCWFPVVVDQVAGSGNLGAMTTFFLTSGDRPAGFGTALHTAADQLRLPGAPWLGRDETAGLDGGLLGAGLTMLIIPIVAMGASLWLSIRTRSVSALRLQLLAIAAAIGGLIATARVIGPVFDWVVRWWWVLAGLWWLSIAWALWSALTRWADVRVHVTTDRVMVGIAAIGGAVVILSATGPITDASRSTPPPGLSTGIVLEEFLEPVLEGVAGSGPLLVVTTGSVRGDYGDALRLQLERSGVEVVVEDNLVSHLGPERSEARRTPTGTLWIVSADAIARFREDPSMRLLGEWDPLTPQERTQFLLDEAMLQDQLIAVGRVDLAEALTNGAGGVDAEAVGLRGVDQDLLRRVEATRRRGDPVAVFLGPPRLY